MNNSQSEDRFNHKAVRFIFMRFLQPSMLFLVGKSFPLIGNFSLAIYSALSHAFENTMQFQSDREGIRVCIFLAEQTTWLPCCSLYQPHGSKNFYLNPVAFPTYHDLGESHSLAFAPSADCTRSPSDFIMARSHDSSAFRYPPFGYDKCSCLG